MSAKAIAFQDELSRARAVAAQRKKELDEAPELTTEEILAGFKRELRSVTVEGFGKVYYYPIGLAEYLDFKSNLDDGSTTASGMVQAIIAFARKSDGSLKFTKEHAAVLLDGPPGPVSKLASAVVGLNFNVVSAEKK